MESVGGVAGREDVRVAGTQRRVHHDPVVHGQPGLLGELGVRGRANSDEDGVGRQLGAVRELHAGHPVGVRGDLGNLFVETEIDLMCAVQIGVHLGDLRPEHAQQRQVGGFHHGDRDSGLAGRRGRLQADPAGADHHQPGDAGEEDVFFSASESESRRR